MTYFLKKLGSFALFTIVLIIVLEALLAIGGTFVPLPFPGPSYDRTLVSRKSLHADINPVFGVWRQANYRARQTGPCFDAVFTTNRWGARDDAWEETPGMRRGILLGDSYVEGYGVNESDRASEVFEQTTHTKLLNLAVAGHCGPTQYRLIYDSFKDSLEHDFVMVGLNLPSELDDEDISKWIKRKRYRPYLEGTYPDYTLKYATVPLNKSVYAVRKTSQSFAKNLMSEYSALYHAVTYLMEHHPSFSKADLPEEDMHAGKFSEENAWRVIYNMEMIKRLAGNKPLYVFFVPNASSFEDNENPTFSFIRARLEEKNIRVLDVNHYISPQEVSGLFFDCDVHWNVVGNKHVGEALGAAFKGASAGAQRP